MDASVSTRNIKSQSEIFLSETSLNIKGLVKCSMRKRGTPIARELFLGDWMKFFDVGPVELGKAAQCTHSYVSNMAANRREAPSVLYLLPISERLGITVNALFQPPPSQSAMASLEQYDPATQTAILGRARRQANR